MAFCEFVFTDSSRQANVLQGERTGDAIDDALLCFQATQRVARNTRSPRPQEMPLDINTIQPTRAATPRR